MTKRQTLRTVPWAVAGMAVMALWAWSTFGTRDTPDASGPVAMPPVASGGSARSPATSWPATRDHAQARQHAWLDLDPEALPAWLPSQAHGTLRLIARGGPFPYRQDGGTFGNRERRLPLQPHGWYREYTVDTPGEDDRGARRIIVGGDPPRALYYTADHYRSFRRIPLETPRQ